MRVLFTTWAWPSHLYPMVALASRLRAAGHDVRVASQPGLRRLIERLGFEAVSVGRDIDAAVRFGEFIRHPDAAVTGEPVLDQPEEPGATEPTTAPAVVGRDAVQAAAGSLRRPRVLGLFAEIAEAMAPELIEFSRSWRPDLIVFEPTAWAGPVAAADLGVPAVRHLYGPDLLWRGREAVTDAVETLAARLGVRGVTPFGAVTIDPCPEALQVPGADYPRLPVRYVPCSGPDVTEDPPEAPFRRPRVCVTWGTTLARIHPRFFLTERIAAVLDPMDVNVLACLTPDQTPLVTAGFRATDTVSLRAAMVTCDLLVAHGGAATVMTAATVGIPALLIPRLPDHDGHAARMEAAGAAIRLDPGRCDADLIRDGVRRLLADRSFRDAAKRLRDDMARRPSPAVLTAPLEKLAAFQPTSSGTRADGHTLTVVHRSPGR